MKRIRFKGKDYILAGGAITTEERYESGTVSYAHLFPDGRVVRYGQEIGTIEDIEFGEEVHIEPTIEGFLNMFSGRSWH